MYIIAVAAKHQLLYRAKLRASDGNGVVLIPGAKRFHPHVARGIGILRARLNPRLKIIILDDVTVFVVLYDNFHILEALESNVINEEGSPLAVNQIMRGNKAQKSGTPFLSDPVPVEPRECQKRDRGKYKERDGGRPCFAPSPKSPDKHRQVKKVGQ